MELPSVEVRFENLHVETLYSESGRNLPTIFNAYCSAFEVRGASVDDAVSDQSYVATSSSLAGECVQADQTGA